MMNSSNPIDSFLAEFAQGIRCGGPGASALLEEIEDHLRERAAQLSENGIATLDAERAAVNCFGSIPDLLPQFEREALLKSEVFPMLRYCIVLVAVLTAAFAALHFAFSWFDDAPWGWTLIKLFVATAVVGYDLALLYQYLPQKTMNVIERWIVFSGALGLVAIGSAATVWTAHLGQVSGDWEWYGFLGGVLLVMQGVMVAGYLAMSGLVEGTRVTLPRGQC